MKETNRNRAKAAKRRARQRKLRNRRIALTVCLMLVVIAASVSGTIAWLTDSTEAIVNTFTYGNIDIELEETTTAYKMVPGTTIAKDPMVTVKAGSEACWLFVKVEKSADFDNFVTFDMADGWKTLEGQPGIYYREVPEVVANANTVLHVLKDDQVSVKADVTKGMLEALLSQPTLTFTAYAVQKAGIADVATAWEVASAVKS